MSQVIVNESPFDQFTLVHGASGVLAHAVGMTFGATLISGFLWDYLIEPRLKQTDPEYFPFPSQDGHLHAFVDALTPAVAWLAYDAYLKRNHLR